MIVCRFLALKVETVIIFVKERDGKRWKTFSIFAADVEGCLLNHVSAARGIFKGIVCSKLKMIHSPSYQNTN